MHDQRSIYKKENDVLSKVYLLQENDTHIAFLYFSIYEVDQPTTRIWT